MKGKKYDKGKPNLIPFFENMPFCLKDFPEEKPKYHDYVIDYDLVPKNAHREITSGFSYGATEYGPENWRLVKPFKKRYFKALLRHIFLYWVIGEQIDRKTGIHHLALAGCCIYFLLEKEIEK